MFRVINENVYLKDGEKTKFVIVILVDNPSK